MNDALLGCYEVLENLMPQALDENPCQADSASLRFFVGRGTLCAAPVTVTVRPIGADAAFIEVVARLIRQVEPSVEVYEALLEENRNNPWGAMALDGDEVLFRRTLNASTVTAAEIQDAVCDVAAFVAVTAPRLGAIGTATD